MRHDRKKGWEVQREQPRAVLSRGLLVAISLGLLRSQRQRALREPLDVRLVRQQLFVRLCRVEKVVAELGTQLAELLLDLIEPLLVGPLEGDASQDKVPQLTVHDPLLGHGQAVPQVPVLDGLESLVDRLRLRQTQHNLDLLRLHLLHGLPQRLGVLDRLEVAHRAPSAAQSIRDPLKRLHEPDPSGLHILLERVNRAVCLVEQLADGRHDVSCVDRVPLWER
mmetsp:Transcript_13187/g.38209  ORF Transcript_13187/g.38209 Transcript_13187/m.38209 type:complete len:223 (-) Transcript_13187:3903-4571(-)